MKTTRAERTARIKGGTAGWKAVKREPHEQTETVSGGNGDRPGCGHAFGRRHCEFSLKQFEREDRYGLR